MASARTQRPLGLLLVAAALLFGAGCVTARQHADQVQRATGEDRLAVGTIQREIRVGMSGAEVLEALGSPNIVSADERQHEVWVYDRISTDTARSSSGALLGGIVFGGSGGAAGLGTGSSGATSKSQRTLTLVIRFDEKRRVHHYAYHASRF
jgi:outer membrane protein assembly factor BamE (lipoprotein component of BamABCDE complex)